MRPVSLLVFMVPLLLAGCASDPGKFEDFLVDSTTEELELGEYPQGAPEQWIGANKNDLIAALGPPPQAIHSSGPEGQGTYNYIYGDGNGSKGCIETYLIEKSTGTVLEYQCY